jgi:hypothetical protein
MKIIPTHKENPKGLHQRYYIQKIVPNEIEIMGVKLGDSENPYRVIPCDDNAEYFVLRLDEKGSDKNHIEACRKAVLTYAKNIAPFIPELAKDLIERYSK